jgi:transposase-like protein
VCSTDTLHRSLPGAPPVRLRPVQPILQRSEFMALQNDHETEKAARRLEQIMAVMRGEKTTTQAAADLGVSRETFYEWNNRALASLREALADRPAGRPPAPPEDQEKVRLQRENDELKKQVKAMEGGILIRDLMDGVPRFAISAPADPPSLSRSKKKP